MAAHILVVEDDPNILLSVQFLLQNAGYTVQTATDGQHAWQRMQSGPPHLVVLDVMLPKLDGFELCQRIRASDALSTVKVLMLSARGSATDIDKCRELGADAYLRKPFATQELLQTVKRLLDAPPQALRV